jgi:DNA modification methylase
MLIRADARALPLRDGCVDCVVTSPPYFGLRDYGHARQIGLQKDAADYVTELVGVFRDVRRVLNDAGTVWLNLGDTYNAYNGNAGPSSSISKGRHDAARPDLARGHGLLWKARKPKDLLGVPWMVAFALQADGWYLRSDIIWSKPNPMPESVTDRPTKAHEYLFLLSKSERYFYDADAIREPLAPETLSSNGIGANGKGYVAGARTVTPDVYLVQKFSGNMASGAQRSMNPDGRNKRSVWNIATMPYSGAHFATMPEKLVEPCILAGCPLGGLVLDPFVGSGTVVAVAQRLGRRGVGVDLSYQSLAKERTAQQGIPFGEYTA